MSDLAFHVRAFVPAADGPELESRVALLRARDFAAGLLATTDRRDAYDLAQLAHETAGRFVFADAPERELRDALTLCRCCVQAAFCADRLPGDGA